MKTINIPNLGTVIWDKSLDYPKLLKQIVDLETKIESLNHVSKNNELMYEREQRALSLLKTKENTNLELHTKNTKLFEDNKNLHYQLTKLKKENVYHWIGLVFIGLVSITTNILF